MGVGQQTEAIMKKTGIGRVDVILITLDILLVLWELVRGQRKKT